MSYAHLKFGSQLKQRQNTDRTDSTRTVHKVDRALLAEYRNSSLRHLFVFWPYLGHTNSVLGK
jgi:hypothetical protein